MTETEPGKWYFAVDCAKCGEAIPFEEAPPPEDDPSPKHRGIRVRCPDCHEEYTYAPALISRREGPESK
jgi:ribosomal protein S27E